MTKTCVALLLAAISSGAMAGWEKIASGNDTMVYADAATIRKSGSIVKMWGLIDNSKPQDFTRGKAFLSVRVQNDYDCNGERLRPLHFSLHSGHMAGGDTVYVDPNPNQQWQPVPPASPSLFLWTYACAK